MAKVHVKKNDTVVVLAGKDRGKKGKISQVNPEKSTVTVEGINTVKRHTKPRPPRIPQGGIIEKTMPLNASNVQLVCPRCNRPTRIGHKAHEEEGKNGFVRVCKKCGEEI